MRCCLEKEGIVFPNDTSSRRQNFTIYLQLKWGIAAVALTVLPACLSLTFSYCCSREQCFQGGFAGPSLEMQDEGVPPGFPRMCVVIAAKWMSLVHVDGLAMKKGNLYTYTSLLKRDFGAAVKAALSWHWEYLRDAVAELMPSNLSQHSACSHLHQAQPNDVPFQWR